MPRKAATNLKVIPATPAGNRPETPRPLGQHGLALWRSVTTTYEFDDPGSIELLCLACQALDRAEECAARIKQDGPLLAFGKMVRRHPLLRDELQFRALCARLVGKLGLDLEPVRSGPGRPGYGAA